MRAKHPHTSVRLDPETLARVEAVRVKLNHPWREATTSDSLRMLICSSLAHVEEHGIKTLIDVHGRRKAGRPAPRTSKNKAGKKPR